LHPLVGCYVIRQVLVRYHSGYDFARLLNSEPPTILLSPGTFLGCPGGISVWNDEDCLDGPIWTGVGMVMELTLTFLPEHGGGKAHVGLRAPGRVGLGVGLPCCHAGGMGARAHSSSGRQLARWCPHVTLPRNPPFCGGIARGSAECGGVCFTDSTGIVLFGENARDRRSHEAQGRWPGRKGGSWRRPREAREEKMGKLGWSGGQQRREPDEKGAI